MPEYHFPALPQRYKGLEHLGQLPKMVATALMALGTHETPGPGDSPIIMGWKRDLQKEGYNIKGYTADAVPWCGLFMAWVAMKSGYIPVDNPLWALNWGKFGVDGGQPELGDILTFVRPSGGHVALYIGESQTTYHVLGGNQGDKVSIIEIDKKRLRACRQPKYLVGKPASSRPYIINASGIVSHNEA